jgi:hypothetical protein
MEVHMALIRWEPVAELNTIQNEMNRLFNNFFEGPAGRGSSTPSRRWIPAMDLVETADHCERRGLPGQSSQADPRDRVSEPIPGHNPRPGAAISRRDLLG